MKTIGLISDTHAFYSHELEQFFSDCDEVWHAGDIGSYDVYTKLLNFKPLKAVYGNIDEYLIRKENPEYLCFKCEDVVVVMTHIGGHPGKYSTLSQKLIQAYHPTIHISGHSHILKVIYDSKNQLLHLNPGAFGTYGIHTRRTMLKFCVEGSRIYDLKIWDREK